MEMTGVASFDSELLRSRSLPTFIDRLTEPKFAKGLRDVFGDAVEEGVEFLLDPKGKSERRARKEGMPEPAGLGVLVWWPLTEPGE